ncbi:MAG: hypothetical protein ACFE8M_12405 [Candidatus Hermodarchaeota archaeon]
MSIYPPRIKKIINKGVDPHDAIILYSAKGSWLIKQFLFATPKL